MTSHLSRFACFAFAHLLLGVGLALRNFFHVEPVLALGANNPTIKGDSTVLWGAGGVYSGTGAGLVTSGSNELTGEKVEIQDKDGATVAAIFFDDRNNVEFEAIIQTSAPTLARGDGVTICGAAYALIDSVTKLWSNKDVQKYRVKATKYAAISAPET